MVLTLFWGSKKKKCSVECHFAQTGFQENTISADGTEAEIQLPLKRFPDSSVSSLIPAQPAIWCGRAFHYQKLAPILMVG